MAEKHGIQKHILFIDDIIDDSLLSTWYYLAYIYVSSVKHIPEDSEGFGIVAIEAATYSAPSITFSTGGITNAIQNNESGIFIQAKSYKYF